MSNPLRKAAILIKSLDKSAAAALLAQMPKAAAKRVLAVAKGLTAIDPQEQQQIMSEFARKSGKQIAAPIESSVGVELSLTSTASEPVEHVQSNATPVAALHDSPFSESRFAFITPESIESLALVLSREQPQLAALILAHLPAQQSAAVLGLLDSSAREAIVQRIAEIDDASPDVLDELERVLRTRLMHEQLRVKGSAQGLAALSGILQASDPTLRSQISAAVGSRGAVLKPPVPLERILASDRPTRQIGRAESIAASDEETQEKDGKSPAIAFTALSALDDISLAAVFGAVTPQVAILALVGADEALVGRILGLLPRKESASFRKKLDEVGPLRLKEVQLAQDQLCKAASALIMDRRIAYPAHQKLRLAA
jgi:flagellar motor switch protein FliG